MATCLRLALNSPVKALISVMRSISSPKNSTRTMVSVLSAGKISTTSPRTRNLLRTRLMSLRSY